MRGRRQERHEDDWVHYKMRQRLVSIGDDFWIEDDAGERVFKVDGKALRLRKTLVLEDVDGHKLAKIQEKMLRIKDAMEVEDADGHRMAMVKKALISPLRERWSVEVEDGPDLHIKGNIVDHEYTFTAEDTPVASVSKQWFRVADTYGVAVEPGQDPVVVLAATVALDMMAHEHR
ncbi:LURP-one-related family protein [Nocardioides panacis]|uniref:LURP-one-related family protein n=1 Tax=Nocardioides panacis TaxID=2849501 RepID=A0A975Y034_9ACTN|nr:LURP-one-related family protein [Nocardioides panacis]QWZ08061.1 LURP-one-related family protein [Nocardioides panacis]